MHLEPVKKVSLFPASTDDGSSVKFADGQASVSDEMRRRNLRYFEHRRLRFYWDYDEGRFISMTQLTEDVNA